MQDASSWHPTAPMSSPKSLSAVYTCVYTCVYTDDMSGRAKIFYNGGSQAVRLPKSCRFPEEQREVVARRVGRKVVLEPADEWSAEFLAALGAWPDEIERPKQQAIRKKKDPFA